MSFKVDKDNIYCIMPFSRYKTATTTIDDFMENDFTIFVKAKIIKESLCRNEPSYFFSRNGMHSGLYATITDDNRIQINFSYWFSFYDNNIMKQCNFYIPIDKESDMNEYIVKCDSINSKMEIFFNGESTGIIDYTDIKKITYIESIIWLGCGSMLSADIYKNIGSFEYDLVFALDIQIDLLKINDVSNNYKLKYLEKSKFNELPILNESIPNKSNYKIFLNFENYTKYKIWDITAIGNYPQLYMENNIYF
jgi:hypothetical protein